MEYAILSDEDFDEIITMVNDFLKKGWKLQGGISVATFHRSWENTTVVLYAQAMVKEEA